MFVMLGNTKNESWHVSTSLLSLTSIQVKIHDLLRVHFCLHFWSTVLVDAPNLKKSNWFLRETFNKMERGEQGHMFLLLQILAVILDWQAIC